MYVCAHSTNMFAIADRKKGGKGVGGGGGGGGTRSVRYTVHTISTAT